MRDSGDAAGANKILSADSLISRNSPRKFCKTILACLWGFKNSLEIRGAGEREPKIERSRDIYFVYVQSVPSAWGRGVNAKGLARQEIE